MVLLSYLSASAFWLAVMGPDQKKVYTDGKKNLHR
jgi:hypothetical protein